MFYQYQQLRIARSTEVITDVLSELARTLDNGPRYVSLQCNSWAVGRPLQLRRRRWFESVNDPAQLWLPFEGFQPARVLSVTLGSVAGAWLLDCQHPGRGCFSTTFNPTREGSDCIVALATYRRVQISERRDYSFNTQSSLCEAQEALCRGAQLTGISEHEFLQAADALRVEIAQRRRW